MSRLSKARDSRHPSRVLLGLPLRGQRNPESLKRQGGGWLGGVLAHELRVGEEEKCSPLNQTQKKQPVLTLGAKCGELPSSGEAACVLSLR